LRVAGHACAVLALRHHPLPRLCATTRQGLPSVCSRAAHNLPARAQGSRTFPSALFSYVAGRRSGSRSLLSRPWAGPVGRQPATLEARVAIADHRSCARPTRPPHASQQWLRSPALVRPRGARACWVGAKPTCRIGRRLGAVRGPRVRHASAGKIDNHKSLGRGGFACRFTSTRCWPVGSCLQTLRTGPGSCYTSSREVNKR
jgi:hypothetical protein